MDTTQNQWVWISVKKQASMECTTKTREKTFYSDYTQ